jgi:glycosyltransferase involved in cell wall biosynthesis
MSKALFVIPYPRFFSQHNRVGGHIAHAVGITDALIRGGWETTVYIEEDDELVLDPNVKRLIQPMGGNGLLARQIWYRKITNEIATLSKKTRFDFCYLRYSASFAPWLPRLKEKLSCPLILEVNSLGSQWRRSLKIFDGRALNVADRSIFISETVRDHAEAMFGGSKKNKVVINGVDVRRFNAGNERQKRVRILVGYAGLLKPDYGIEDIIAVGSKLPHLDYRIYGDGPIREELKKQASLQGNVVLMGAVPFSEMPATLMNLDILVYVTGDKYKYQSPTKLFEYMASGRAIVCARTEQTEKIIVHGHNGLLFEIGDIDGMAQLLERLDCDIELRNQLGANARKDAERLHSWGARLNEILEGVAGR